MADLETDALSVPGLEARHIWTPDDGSGAVTLNEPRGTIPRYKLEQINGLYDDPEAADDRTALPGLIGERPWPTQETSKTISYEGEIRPETLGSLRYRIGLLKRGFRKSVSGQMQIVPAAAYGGETYRWRGRPTLVSVPELVRFGARRQPSPHQRSFVIAIRMEDPRFYYGAEQAADSPVSAGAAVVLDIANGDVKHAPVLPVLRIHGPIVDPRIEVSDNGGATWRNDLSFTTAALNTDAKFLDIDFARRSLIDNTGAARDTWLDRGNFESTWWDPFAEGLNPGPQRLRLTGQTAINAGAKFRVWWTPAVW